MSCGPYRIPHVHCHGRLAYTNKMRFGAFRGFGVPQVTFAGETQMDEIADALGLDPIEFRLKNLKREGDCWLGGQPIEANRARRAAAKAGARSALPVARTSAGSCRPARSYACLKTAPSFSTPARSISDKDPIRSSRKSARKRCGSRSNLSASPVPTLTVRPTIGERPRAASPT